MGNASPPPDGLWREGEYWTLRFRGRQAHLRDSKGLAYLAEVLRHPEREFHSLDLVRHINPADVAKASPATELATARGEGTGPALDSKAKEAYRARIEELRETISEAESWNDNERAARAKAELDALAKEMSRAVGLGGRDRPVASQAERARQNVGRAIRKAIKTIAGEVPAAGAHLERAVHTGMFISYNPLPDQPLPVLSEAPPAAASEDQAGVDRLPSGVVTLLMTDIEGSTRLWEESPAEMAAALAGHDQLIEKKVADHHGHLIKTKGEGDSTFSVFLKATDALACAVEVLSELDGSTGAVPLKVRMSLHTGEVEGRDGEYFGPATNRCARIREIGHGGQLLISTSTYELVRDRLPQGSSIKDLGKHRLRDLQRPEPIYQLVHPGLEQEFPPLRSRRWQAHNLPPRLTSFVGRSRELERISAALTESRFVTLTGAGGSGKTRLATETAAGELPRWSDGAWLVDLAPIFETEHIARAVALSLGVKERPNRDLLEDVTEHIGDSEMLLLLDNCEHLLDACADIASRLIECCSELQILATSREPLGVLGEVVFRVGSLEVPENQDQKSIEAAESVRLFADRARAAVGSFTVEPETTPVIAAICRRLDGLPLAIELAAARLKMFSVYDLEKNLENSFKLLSGGLRTSLPRHRTLEATVSWSYDLLNESQRRLFDRLSVFSGGWSLEGALQTLESLGFDQDSVLEDLEALIDKSLVLREERPGGRVRYRMLETLRQYGNSRLGDSGKLAEARDAHLQWMRGLCWSADAKLDGAEAGTHLDLLEEEIDNLRTSLEWSIAAENSEAGLLIVSAGFANFWIWRSHLPEGRTWLERLLSMPGEVSSSRAKGLLSAARLAFQSGDWEGGFELAEKARDAYRLTGDAAGESRSIMYMAMNKWSWSESEEIETLIEEALVPARRAGQPVELALGHGLMALWLAPRDSNRAREHGDEAAGHAEASGSLNWKAHIREFRAHVALFEGKLAEAAELISGAIPLYMELGNRSCGSHCLETVAAYLAQRGELSDGAELLGAVSSERKVLGAAPPAYERIGYERALATLEEGLDARAMKTAWDRGAEITYDEAVEHALTLLRERT